MRGRSIFAILLQYECTALRVGSQPVVFVRTGITNARLLLSEELFLFSASNSFFLFIVLSETYGILDEHSVLSDGR